MEKVTEIRKVRDGDAKLLAYIQTESWKAAFSHILSKEDLQRYTDVTRSEEMYTMLLSKEIGNGYLLLVNGEPHCMLYWDKAREADLAECAELICIHSLSDNWNKGYGSIMQEHALVSMEEAGFREVILWVFEENSRARQFYEKHGFILTEHKKSFCDAIELMYRKELQTQAYSQE